MKNAVDRYRERRRIRLKARGYRADDGEENNSNNKKGGGGHGNTKLPFGLCQREGIEIGKGWTPRDAWDALAGKGITPGGEYARLGKKSTTVQHGETKYTNVHVQKFDWGGGKTSYLIMGDMQPREGEKIEALKKVNTNAQIASFQNKKEMFAWLRDYGVNHATDPDTGEKIDPTKMDLPKTVAVGRREERYTDLVLGTRREKSGRAYDHRGFTLVAKDYDGKKWTLGTFETPEEAMSYAKKTLKCKDEDLRQSKDYKAWKEEYGTVEKEREKKAEMRKKWHEERTAKAKG